MRITGKVAILSSVVALVCTVTVARPLPPAKSDAWSEPVAKLSGRLRVAEPRITTDQYFEITLELGNRGHNPLAIQSGNPHIFTITLLDVAVPNIMGVILVIIGKRVIGQACVVTTTISPTVVMMGAMLICTGLICVSLSCVAYALVRPSFRLNGNNLMEKLMEKTCHTHFYIIPCVSKGGIQI